MRKQSQKKFIVLFVVLFFLLLLTTLVGKAQVLSADELETKPVLQSYDDALKAPKDAYRLFMCGISFTSPAAEIEKLVNLHEIYLDTKQVSFFAEHLPKLKVLQIVYIDAGEATESEKQKIKQMLGGLKFSFDF